MWVYLWTAAALAQGVVIDSKTLPGELDVTTGAVYTIATTDPKLDLSAFVVVTAEGDWILDELLASADATSKGLIVARSLGPVLRQSKPVSQVAWDPLTCVTVAGIQVCVPKK